MPLLIPECPTFLMPESQTSGISHVKASHTLPLACAVRPDSDACLQAPKTNFTAVAAAVKDVAARGAAAASVQSGWKEEPVAIPAKVEDVLRDPPESGAPVDESDRYSSSCWLARCHSRVQPFCKVSGTRPLASRSASRQLLPAGTVRNFRDQVCMAEPHHCLGDLLPQAAEGSEGGNARQLGRICAVCLGPG